MDSGVVREAPEKVPKVEAVKRSPVVALGMVLGSGSVRTLANKQNLVI